VKEYRRRPGREVSWKTLRHTEKGLTLFRGNQIDNVDKQRHAFQIIE
jgi:hypothetical protein